MPRASYIVQGAPSKTRWTLSQQKHDTPLQSPTANGITMQANGYYDHGRDQRYASYDGSQYSVASGRTSSAGGWKPPPNMNGGGNFDGFDFNTSTMDERRSMHLDTQVRQHNPDVVGRHLLYETALMDSQSFEILDIQEVDALKKEQGRLSSRIEAAQRKLQLESKVRDAAQNLQRLYSTNTKNRPDTPQSPDSPKKNRNSLLPRDRGNNNRLSTGPEALQQADSELSSSVRKVDELHEQLRELLDRREHVKEKLLRHTAAILAEEANRVAESAVPGLSNGHHHIGDDDMPYTPNDFDGIRDILQGMPAGARSKEPQNDRQLEDVQERLEQLNYQLRNVISEAGQTLGKQPAAEIGLDQSDDSSARLENRFSRLEHNLHALEQQQNDVQSHFARVQESEHFTRNAVEKQLEEFNGHLHNTLLLASETQAVPGLEEPPRSTGQGYQNQLQYMEESLMTVEQLLQHQDQSRGHSREIEELQADHSKAIEELHGEHSKAIEELHEDHSKEIEELHEDHSRSIQAHQTRNGEYENTVTGLWDLLQSDVSSSPRIGADEEGRDSPSTTGFKESFSLEAFSSRVQNIFDRAQSAKDQQDILRRQIQQQRELNGKSDAEKDRQLTDLQTQHDQLNAQHDQLNQDHGAVQQELANFMVKHEQLEGESSNSRSELVNVMNEFESLKKTVETKQQEHDEISRSATGLQDQVRDLEAQVADLNENHGASRTDMEALESEVVRLTTELTMAKAELDGAYGTRKERAGAQAAEVEQLSEKNKSITSELTALKTEVESLRGPASSASQLERELQEMTSEFQDMTKESIELEKERSQLDALIDSLRDRVDMLEAQVAEEKLRHAAAREQTGMMVLRQEFKKMMRVQRAEGVKLLRAEQEERRKIEAELRRIRQASTPLAKHLPELATTNSTNSVGNTVQPVNSAGGAESAPETFPGPTPIPATVADETEPATAE